MYFIVLYLFNLKDQVGVCWKSFEKYLNIFHLRSYSLKLVHEKQEHLKNFIKNFSCPELKFLFYSKLKVFLLANIDYNYAQQA